MQGLKVTGQDPSIAVFRVSGCKKERAFLFGHHVQDRGYFLGLFFQLVPVSLPEFLPARGPVPKPFSEVGGWRNLF